MALVSIFFVAKMNLPIRRPICASFNHLCSPNSEYVTMSIPPLKPLCLKTRKEKQPHCDFGFLTLFSPSLLNEMQGFHSSASGGWETRTHRGEWLGGGLTRMEKNDGQTARAVFYDPRRRPESQHPPPPLCTGT